MALRRAPVIASAVGYCESAGDSVLSAGSSRSSRKKAESSARPASPDLRYTEPGDAASGPRWEVTRGDHDDHDEDDD